VGRPVPVPRLAAMLPVPVDLGIHWGQLPQTLWREEEMSQRREVALAGRLVRFQHSASHP